MMWTMARFKHPLALPAVLLAIVALFHAALLATGMSLQEAQAAGWVMKPAVSSLPCSTWLLHAGGLHGSQLGQ